jgi:hypothetical protein
VVVVGGGVVRSADGGTTPRKAKRKPSPLVIESVFVFPEKTDHALVGMMVVQHGVLVLLYSGSIASAVVVVAVVVTAAITST